jgi:hypothetical protein
MSITDPDDFECHCPPGVNGRICDSKTCAINYFTVYQTADYAEFSQVISKLIEKIVLFNIKLLLSHLGLHNTLV